MFKIVLLCAGGASTGMLAKKMEEVAKTVNLECTVNAFGVSQASSVAADADVVMLGPQVGFRLDEVKKALPGKAVTAIEMNDYGNMNAKRILSNAVKAYKANKAAQNS